MQRKITIFLFFFIFLGGGEPKQKSGTNRVVLFPKSTETYTYPLNDHLFMLTPYILKIFWVGGCGKTVSCFFLLTPVEKKGLLEVT